MMLVAWWLKKILGYVDIQVRFHSGDMVHVKLIIGEKVVLDREVDILPKV